MARASAAERWVTRQTRRLARDAELLSNTAKMFADSVERSPGPWADETRDLVKRTMALMALAASLDGMQEIMDLMTEEA